MNAALRFSAVTLALIFVLAWCGAEGTLHAAVAPSGGGARNPKEDTPPGPAPAKTAPANVAGGDWPQWRGPNRDGVAPSSPKLLDAWPKDGPKRVWKSEPIPFGWGGGWGSLVVSEGKVFFFVEWARAKYKAPITAKFLELLGWIPGVPDDLAKKLEEALASPKRPNPSQCPTMQALIFDNPDLNAFLAKQPELDKYIKDFVAALKPDEATKFGALVKRRLCMRPFGFQGAEKWESLVKLSKLQDQVFKTGGKFNDAMAQCGISANADGSVGTWAGAMGSLPPMETLVCLDAATGKMLWKKEFEVAAVKPGGGYGYPMSTTPAVGNGKVYFIARTGTYCLSTKDGSVVWETKRGAYAHSSFLVDNELAYDPTGMAYDANTGRELWKPKDWRASSTTTSPVLWKTGGKKYIVCGGFCIDRDNGKLLWEKPVQNNEATPIVQDENLLINDYDGLKAMKLSTPEKPPELIWKKGFNTRENRVSPILYHGRVFGIDTSSGNNDWVCADLATGDIKWRGPKGFSSDMSSPVIADDKVIVFGPPGNSHSEKGCGILMFKATSEKYEEVGRFDPHAGACQSPAIADGKLYFRTESEDGDYGVSCYDLTVAGNR